MATHIKLLRNHHEKKNDWLSCSENVQYILLYAFLDYNQSQRKTSFGWFPNVHLRHTADWLLTFNKNHNLQNNIIILRLWLPSYKLIINMNMLLQFLIPNVYIKNVLYNSKATSAYLTTRMSIIIRCSQILKHYNKFCVIILLWRW